MLTTVITSAAMGAEPQMLATIITSAAVGAVISSAVTFAAQCFERRARRQELLLAKSIDLVHEHLRFTKEIVAETGMKAVFPTAVTMVADCYQLLQNLMNKGELPKDFVERATKSLDEQKAKLKARP
ncbi:MAG TPA: hypothetical protein VLC46_08475 [Thermoanaerobaculia bacterium]|jgi:hypothetical protein|nr:hypothetical protein [Thermoanaerobaculia bacterium]